MPQRGELETTRRGRSSRERGERNRFSGVEGSCGNAQTSLGVVLPSGRSSSSRHLLRKARPRGSALRERHDEGVGSTRTGRMFAALHGREAVLRGEREGTCDDPDERVRPRGCPDERGARRWVSARRHSRVDRVREEASERARRRWAAKLGNQRGQPSRARERRQGSSSAPSGEAKRRKGAVRGPGRSANGSSIVTKTSDVGESKESDEAMVHGPPKGVDPGTVSTLYRAARSERDTLCVSTRRGDEVHLERVSRSRMSRPRSVMSAGSSGPRASCSRGGVRYPRGTVVR